MKRNIVALAAAAALVTGLAGTSASAQDKLSIVVGHTLSPTSQYAIGAEAFIDKLGELSGGASSAENAT